MVIPGKRNDIAISLHKKMLKTGKIDTREIMIFPDGPCPISLITKREKNQEM
jgi:hypothetical protein